MTLEHLRQAVGLRGYAQRDPLHEYKSEAFQLFEQMLGRLRRDVTGQLMHVVLTPKYARRIRRDGSAADAGSPFRPHDRRRRVLGRGAGSRRGCPEIEARAARSRETGEWRHPQARRPGGGAPGGRPQQGKGRGQHPPALDRGISASWGKVSRNAPCPCGSGKKFKHCHGAIASAAAGVARLEALRVDVCIKRDNLAIPIFKPYAPVLRVASEARPNFDVVERLADDFALSAEDRSHLLPSGRQTTFANRVHWAKSFLGKAGLIELTKRAHFRITEDGRKVLAAPPERIDIRYLNRFPSFQAVSGGWGRRAEWRNQRRRPLLTRL